MFDQLKLIFIDYLNASQAVRYQILEASLQKLDQDANLSILNEAMVFHSQLLRYAQLIDDIENQRPFGFLADYWLAMHEQRISLNDLTFQLDGQTHYLGQYFDIQKEHLKLLKTPKEIPVEAYVVFQNLQKQLMKNNPNFQFIFNPNKPENNLIYPVLIQGLGHLNNTAVDHVYVNNKGETLFVKNRFGYQLPGGGMFNKLNPTRQDILKKVLDEYLEEQQSSLYRYTYLFDELDKSFLTVINKVIDEGNEDHQFPSDLKKSLKNIVSIKSKSNSKLLQQCIEKIDEEIASPALNSLRASIQVEPFKLHPIYDKALEFLDDCELVCIEQLLDVRALASTQKSYCALLKNISLEDWFEAQGLKESAYSDDLAGSRSETLNFYQAIQLYKEVRFSHLLIFLAAINLRIKDDNFEHVEKDLSDYLSLLKNETRFFLNK